MSNKKYKYYSTESELCSIAYKDYDASSLEEQCRHISIPVWQKEAGLNTYTPLGTRPAAGFSFRDKNIISRYKETHFENIKQTKNHIKDAVCATTTVMADPVQGSVKDIELCDSYIKIKHVEECIAMIDMHKEVCDFHNLYGRMYETAKEIGCVVLPFAVGCSYSLMHNSQFVLDEKFKTDKINVAVVLAGRLPLELAEIIADDSVIAPETNYAIDILSRTLVSAPLVALYRWWNSEESQEDGESNTLIGTNASTPIVSEESYEDL